MGFLADSAAVAQVQPLGWLISAGNLGELALIAYAISPQLLPGYVGHRRGLAFSDPFYGLNSMLIAERTMSFGLFWHLHFYHFAIFTLLLNFHFDG
jgi:hypothetical protein